MCVLVSNISPRGFITRDWKVFNFFYFFHPRPYLNQRGKKISSLRPPFKFWITQPRCTLDPPNLEHPCKILSLTELSPLSKPIFSIFPHVLRLNIAQKSFLHFQFSCYCPEVHWDVSTPPDTPEHTIRCCLLTSSFIYDFFACDLYEGQKVKFSKFVK